jgi:hypothetical protein
MQAALVEFLGAAAGTRVVAADAGCVVAMLFMWRKTQE